MAARSVVACLGALALALSSAVASDAEDAAASVAASEAAVAGAVTSGSAFAVGDQRPFVDPRMSPEMSQKNRDQLIVAFQIALERVREVPECRELFNELGADGTSTVAKIFFFPVGRDEAKANVCNGTVAYTLVGGGPTWLCRDFWRLPDKKAAMVVIHEALHHAGLGEWPKNADAMTSVAINRMVARRCGL